MVPFLKPVWREGRSPVGRWDEFPGPDLVKGRRRRKGLGLCGVYGLAVWGFGFLGFMV